MTREPSTARAGSLLVWVAGWQIECCGVPFAVGSRVELMLLPVTDRDWYTAVLGPDCAQRITHSDERHEEPGVTGPRPTIGTVAQIRAVCAGFGPASGNDWAATRFLAPIPGTAAVVDVTEADGAFRGEAGLSFEGYLVDFEPDQREVSAAGSPSPA